MNVKNLKHYKPHVSLRQVLIGLGVIAAIFVLINLLVLIFYHGKAYPNSTIAGKAVSGKSFKEINLGLDPSTYIPAAVTVSSGTGSQTVETDSIVNSIDNQLTIDQLKKNYSLLPLLNLFSDHHSALVVTFKQEALSKTSTELAKSLSTEAKSAEIVIKKGYFSLVPQEIGNGVKADTVQSGIENTVKNGQTTAKIATQELQPEVKTQDLQNSYNSLKAQQSTAISYTISGVKVQVPPQDISKWYEKKSRSYVLSDELIRAYLVGKGADAGYTINNLSDAVSQTAKAIQSNNQTALTLKVSKIVKIYTYCIAFKGVNSDNLATLSQKLASVYSDIRGWSLNGQVAFKYVKDNCQYTVWLSAAKFMPTFGSICDSMWSCRVGSNVVLNYNRWQNASDAWNKAGGSLDNYRSMVINHETGHYLGFGHAHCSGSGKQAPVMQQQSINLEGCKFNPWPLSAELAQLKARIF